MTNRYIVIGAGAVGIALAAGLAEVGTDVILVSRGSTYDAIRDNGISFSHAGRDKQLDVDVVADPGAVALRRGDVLVFATKTQDVAAALAAWARQPVAEVTAGQALIAVTTQNGLEAERAALRHFARVLSGTTLIAARHVVPGVVQVRNGPAIGQLILGPEASPELTADDAGEIAVDLRRAGWLVHETDEPRRWKAWKALQSVAFPVDVLSGTDEERTRLRELLRAEARSVLEQEGYEFAEPDIELSYDRARAAVSHENGFVPGQLSTWQSFARGSGSEVDYLGGEIVLRARLAGTDAPANRVLQSVLAAAEAAGERPGERRIADVLASIEPAGIEPASIEGVPA